MDTRLRPPLEEIKQRLRDFQGSPTSREFLTCDTIAGGVPRGVLCEVVGSARTEWVLRFLKQNPDLNTFWAEEEFTLFPTALHQRGIDLTRILMVETGSRLFHALRKALRSKLFDCVVLPGVIKEVKVLKALQLFARESNSCVFLLSKVPKSAWSISFQIEAQWGASPDVIHVEILKIKCSEIKNG